METDGVRNQRNLLARLVIFHSGAIGASDSHTHFSRQAKTPTTHSVPYGMRILGAPLRTNSDLHHKIIDQRAERFKLVKRSVGHRPSRISSRPGQASTWIRNGDSNFLEKLRVNISSALNHSAKLPPSEYL